MAKIINKSKTLKTAGLITLLASVLTIGGITYNEYSKTYEAQLRKEIANMPDSEIEKFINECDTALERLQQTIDSDKSNPEERFEARRAYNSILKKRTEMQKELNSRQKNTIRFDSGRYDR